MKQKIVKSLQGKEIYFIYLFSYPTFIILNNFFSKIYGLIFYKKIDFRITFWAVWCKKWIYDFQKVVKPFLAFEVIKLVLIFLIFLVYRRQVNDIYKKNIFEFCVSFLLFDLLYLILLPINSYLDFNLNWYYGSQLYQLILDNFSACIVPAFWGIVLMFFNFYTEKRLGFKLWIYRLAGVFVSFTLFCTTLKFAPKLFLYLLH
jgi:hypothetical protein